MLEPSRRSRIGRSSADGCVAAPSTRKCACWPLVGCPPRTPFAGNPPASAQRFQLRSTSEEVRPAGSLAALHGTARPHRARPASSLHTLGSVTGRTAGSDSRPEHLDAGAATRRCSTLRIRVHHLGTHLSTPLARTTSAGSARLGPWHLEYTTSALELSVQGGEARDRYAGQASRFLPRWCVRGAC